MIKTFAYLGLTWALLVSLLRTRRYRNKDANLLRVSAGAVFVGMTVAGVMITVWDSLLPLVYAWALVGMALAVDWVPPDRTLSRPDWTLDVGKAQLLRQGPALGSILKS